MPTPAQPFADLWQQTAAQQAQFFQASVQLLSAYQQAVNSIVAARLTTAQQVAGSLPPLAEKLAACQTPPQAVGVWAQWGAVCAKAGYQLALTTQAERGHLLNTSLRLMQRASGHTATTPPAWPEAKPAQPAAAQPAPQAPAQAAAPPVKPSFSFLPGRFIPGPRVAQPVAVAAVPTPQLPETTPSSAEETQATPATSSSTATSFSRSSVAAAQVVAATTRRSVLARHASRPRRAGGGAR